MKRSEFLRTSAALASSANPAVDVLNLIGQGTAATINMGAYITDDMGDPVGVRPESVTRVPPIVWSSPYAR